MYKIKHLFEIVTLHNGSNLPYLGLYDAEKIIEIRQKDDKHCFIIFESDRTLIACGTYRHLTNRWLYTLEKKEQSSYSEFYKDSIIRPSTMVFHNPQEIEEDMVFFSKYELVQLVKALKPELLEQLDKLNNIN
jgi:hypothetical protein